MIRRLIILLLIIGCNNIIESSGEFKEVLWIYYGNQNQDMGGCFWTQEYVDDETSAIPMFNEGSGGIGTGLLAGHVLSCRNYGNRNYIHHYVSSNYFSIYLEGSISPQDYDSLVFEYKYE